MKSLWKAHVYITLKPGVLDPQGSTIQRVLTAHGFDGLKDVRVGKFIELELTAASRRQAENAVEEMCRRLLANPVLENYRFTLTQADGEATDSP